jgi:uncharacterized protein (TIRG00374 family)
MRRLAFLILSLIISLALLAFVFRDVPLQEIMTTLQQANPAWAFAAVLSVILGLFTRGIRWRGLLGNRLSIRDSFLMVNITFLLNLLPFRLGEVARSLLATRRQVPLVTAATSILVERLLDLFLVVLLLAWAVSQLPTIDSNISLTALVFGLLSLIAFALMLFFARFPQLPKAIVQRFPFSERLAPLLDNLLDGLQPLTRWQTLGHALLWTVISWGISLFILYACGRALGFADSPLLLALGMGLSSLSVAVPATFAGFGLIEGAIQVSGTILGLDAVSVTALGFLFHGLTVLGYLIAGIPSVWLLGLSFGDLFATKDATLSK